MIEKNTVFILGAGSSKPYGFPTGPELKFKIVNNFLRIQMKMIDSINDLSISEKEDTKNSTIEFLTKYRNSGTDSIDLFLSRNPDYINIGKTAIIKIIKDCENQSNLIIDPKKRGDDWYTFIYNLMSEDFKTPDEYFISQNNVTFITFNYDRSLEYYLHMFLKNSFGKINELAINKEFNKIKIIHVYGKIADLEFHTLIPENVLRFKEKLHDLTYKKFLDNIRIINEERTTDGSNPLIPILQDAERIYFLGFDYARENLDTLGIGSDYPILLNGGEIIGTAYGKTDSEIGRIRNEFSNRNITSDQMNIVNMKSLDLLKEYIPI